MDIDEYVENATFVFSTKMGSVELRLPGRPIPDIVLNSEVGIKSIENDFDVDKPGEQAPVIRINTKLAAIDIRKK